MEQDDVGLGDLSSDGKVLIITDDSLCRHSHKVTYISNSVSVISEMSVDSDRDSVIESEDDKEEVISFSHFFTYIYFFFLFFLSLHLFVFLIL